MVCGGAPSRGEENRLISSRSIAKVCLQPIDESLPVMDMPRLDGPLEAVRRAVCTGREGGRKPALQSQKGERRTAALFITHAGGHCDHGHGGGRGRRTRRLPARTTFELSKVRLL